MKNKCVDVLIIGAGPTGLMMALEALRYGLTCRIIDKGTSYQDQSRAVAIQAQTLEIFGHVGLAESFLKAGLRVKAANPISSFRRLARVSFDILDSPYPFILSLEQAKTEKILEDHLSSMGVKVERGVELLKLHQGEGGVEALVTGETLHATWVVGCDGAHSQVRKELNLSFEGKAFSDIFSLADVRIQWDYPHDEFFVFLNAEGLMAAIPLPEPSRYRLIFQLERCRDLLKKNRSLPSGELREEMVAKPNIAEIQELLCKYAGSHVRVSDPSWCANFYINSRMVETYRKGSVFLAGDAAHIHSPVGGQGMNTGLQDAFNLAWKLALVHKKQAGKELLDTYDLERRAVGKKLLKATERASQMATLRNSVAIALRNVALSCLMRMTFFRKFFVKMISQTGIRYPGGVFRAPNASLMDQDKPTDLYTLWSKSTSFHLLIFTGREMPDLTSIFEQIAHHPIIPIVIFQGDKLPLLPEGVRSCRDPRGSAHRIYGVKGSRVVLIRPDLYIGYQADNIRGDHAFI